MSGRLSWAIVAPSRNSTIECTIDCGCTTTSIWSYAVPNSSWASITSRPLFISVLESTVILGPIDHVGWARASATVTPARSAARRPRNGPPLAVSSNRGNLAVGVHRRAQALVDRPVLGVDGDQLGARNASERLHHRAGGDEALLVGQGEPLAGAQRGDGDGQAGEADDAVDHHVGHLGQVGEIGDHRAGRQRLDDRGALGRRRRPPRGPGGTPRPGRSARRPTIRRRAPPPRSGLARRARRRGSGDRSSPTSRRQRRGSRP